MRKRAPVLMAYLGTMTAILHVIPFFITLPLSFSYIQSTCALSINIERPV